MSFVNKSNKKFAPKAQQRARPRPTASNDNTPTPNSTPGPAQSPAPVLVPQAGKDQVDDVINQGTTASTSAVGTRDTASSSSISNESSNNRQVTPIPGPQPAANTQSHAPPIVISSPSRGLNSRIPAIKTTASSVKGVSIGIPGARSTPPLSNRGLPIAIPGARTIVENGEMSSTLRQTNPSLSLENRSATQPLAPKRRRVDGAIAIPIPGQQTPARLSVAGPVSSTQLSASESDIDATSGPSDGANGLVVSKKKRKRQPKALNGAATEAGVGVNVEEPARTKRRGRPRASTPENAETVEIQPGIVKMLDLCKDTFIGKKSERYKEIEKIDWTDVVRKQRARRAEIEAAKEAGTEVHVETVDERLERIHRENAANAAVNSNSREAMIAPQMRLVNGQLILDEASLQIDRRERDAVDDGPMELVQESNLTRRVNSATWGRRERTERWDEEETMRFYESLSMFGTDFEMSSRMFYGRSRRQLKNKFTVEERRNPGRVTEALKRKIRVDINDYARLADKKFSHTILEDVEEELRKIREEHEAGQEAQARQGSELAKERNAAAVVAIAESSPGNTTQLPAPKKGRKGKNKMPFSRQEGAGEVIIGTIA